MADHGQKTEKPTQRRLERARSEGNFPASREFVSAAQFLVFVALMAAYGGIWFRQALRATRGVLHRAFAAAPGMTHLAPADLTIERLTGLARDLVILEVGPLLGGAAALALTVLFAQLGVTRFGFSGKKLIPDFSRLHFFTRIQSLPAQNVPLFLQSLILLPLVGFTVYYEVSENLQIFLALPWMSVQTALVHVTGILRVLFWRVGSLFLIIGIADLFWQRRRYTNQLRMTKQDVRDEAKEQQGNPQIKLRIRRLQRDMARRQMMKEVPKATAVIVNPTHFAVAIRYAIDTGGAPKVVAKGKNYLALRIRQKAIEHQVPIVENAPLAQALYKSVEIGQEIPANLYRAVAEILAYIYRLMNGRLPG